ncbi:RNA-binding domain-containing protein [Ceratobasidium sp. AG-I]|nr:RNA-binding domain-containing protein [Ceratobasidium sp. AG-I]
MGVEVYAPRAGQGQGQGQEFGRGGQQGFARHSVSGADAYYVREGQRGGGGGGEFGAAPPRSRSVDAEELFNSNAVLGVEGGRVLGVEGGRGVAGANGLSEGARLESARALLGVLNSADPYNTTVFVGGLSGLIAEETLRGFFAPFGEIHYVKIPPGKGCGFVQFVRKADAERAIERMQGFPIGGGKIRLSWGRSQCEFLSSSSLSFGGGEKDEWVATMLLSYKC